MRTGPRAVGLVFDRGAAGPVAQATGVLEFVIALQEVLATRNLALVLQIVDGPEAAVALYGEWWAERRFDVMVVTDVLVEDPRIDALRRLRAPAVVVGAGQSEHDLAAVTLDDGEAFARVGRYLLELGHRHVALVSGPTELVRTRDAPRGARRGCSTRRAACSCTRPPAGTAEEAAAATRRLLTGGRAPTAIVYDSDQMAVAALDVARRTGLAVPWDLSVVAGSDSALCRLATPSITTLPSAQRDLGTATGEAVLAVLDGDLRGPARAPDRRARGARAARVLDRDENALMRVTVW